jgi:LysM repeat protein
LGRHSKKSRIAYRLTGAAIPALASAGMAICLSPQQALASTSVVQPAASYATTVDTAFQLGHSPAPTTATVSAVRQAAQPTWYTVRPGDSLSTIANRVYHDSSAWPVLYYANRSHIHWANDIVTGQKLKVPAKPSKIPAAPGLLGPAAAPAPVPSAPTGTVTATADSTYSGGGGGSFGACVIARESGGNSQVMNSSGHYGLYQFSASTWAEYGGSPADFGHASVAEQNQVFNTAVASGGQSNWSAYDGC